VLQAAYRGLPPARTCGVKSALVFIRAGPWACTAGGQRSTPSLQVRFRQIPGLAVAAARSFKMAYWSTTACGSDADQQLGPARHSPSGTRGHQSAPTPEPAWHQGNLHCNVAVGSICDSWPAG
jgi:hypothetical protein